MRIGVTGHRSLVDPDAAAAAVDAVLDRLLAEATDENLVVISALAEGADRIVAERVLARPGATLEVVLPLDADDYEDDFTTAESKAAFRALLAQATHVTTTGPDHTDARVSAYERAGRAMVDTSDVVVALWDGKPGRGRGGTAETVAYARAEGKAVEVICVEQGPR